MKEHQKTLYLVQGALIAALYVVLTLVAAGFDLASGAIQVRISEALCILPFFTPAAVPGLFVGCLAANLVTGSALPDIIFGSLATLLGALGTRALRKHSFLCSLPPVLSNMIIVPLVLRFAYMVPLPVPLMMLTVGIGEVISCGVLGMILLIALEKYKGTIFRRND
jgi:uncharacterized membrane protein